MMVANNLMRIKGIEQQCRDVWVFGRLYGFGDMCSQPQTDAEKGHFAIIVEWIRCASLWKCSTGM
jgi:hypothetical protein